MTNEMSMGRNEETEAGVSMVRGGKGGGGGREGGLGGMRRGAGGRGVTEEWRKRGTSEDYARGKARRERILNSQLTKAACSCS